MKLDRGGISFTWPAFAAACLTAAPVPAALWALCLGLELRPAHLAAIPALLLLSGLAVSALLRLGGGVYRFFVEEPPARRRGRILFWCLYPCLLCAAALLLPAFFLL